MTCPCEKNQCSGSNPNQVLQLVKECDPILFHKVERPASLGDETVTPPETLPYKNVLLTYLANNHSYLYSSDGIPTLISLGESSADIPALEAAIEELQTDLGMETSERVEADAAINEDLEKVDAKASANAQAIATETTNREEADTNLQSQINSLSESVETQLDSLDASLQNLDEEVEQLSGTSVQTDTVVFGDTSTVTITKTTGLLRDATKTETAMPLPVASEEQAGVMNTATFNAVQENSENIDSILGGAVVVETLPADPTQEQLTEAWETATGKTELINRASIFDEPNNKVWYYYENVNAWKAISTDGAEVSVSIATNEAVGIVKGSTEAGQIAVEADGTMSLNGYDGITHDIDNLSELIAGIDVPKLLEYTLSAPNLNQLWYPVTTADSVVIRGNIVQQGEGDGANVALSTLPAATTLKAGVMTAADKTKLNNLLEINSLGDGLELSEDGVLSATGGGSDVNLLTAYTASPEATDVYDASYINKKLTNYWVAIGSDVVVYTNKNSQLGGVGIGKGARSGSRAVAIGISAVADTTGGHTGHSVAIGYEANAIQDYNDYNIAIGAYSSSKTPIAPGGAYNVALGAYSQSSFTRVGEVSVGGYTGTISTVPKTRFLANVTAGELPTDAVNLQQMQDYVAEHAGGSQLTEAQVTKVQNLGYATLMSMDGVTQYTDKVEIDFERQNLVAGGATLQTATIAAATNEEAGVMLATDKAKLDAIPELTEMQWIRTGNLPPAVVTGFEDTTYGTDTITMHLDTKDLATGGVSVQELMLEGATANTDEAGGQAGIMTAFQATQLAALAEASANYVTEEQMNTAISTAVGNINTALTTLISGTGAN